MGNEFWAFSLATYGCEEGAQASLVVQDELGLDVNIVLYAAWLATMDRQLTRAHLRSVDSSVSTWRDRVVSPLRSLRRDLREYAPAEGVREQLKALELQSEQQQQEMMWAFYHAAPPLPEKKRPLEGNLGLLVTVGDSGRAPWRTLVSELDRNLAG